MRTTKINIEPLITSAAQYGLIARGGFVVDADDGVPEVHGEVARYVVLFGNAGSAMWDVFSRSDEYHDNLPHPLNRWSEKIGCGLVDEFADGVSMRALFPFGLPHRPFLRWGKKAEALQNSRLGMLIHPRFGLWHAYRFALAFSEVVRGDELAQREAGEPICDGCAGKPCLQSCPVNAFSVEAGEARYDVQTCFGYLQANPDSKCMTAGCQARGSCPQGVGYVYEPPHAGFHMRAFVAAIAAGEMAPERADSNIR